ncbi:methionyl-tRNA formyltransferase [Azospirillum sp. sgz302134]
MADPRVLFLGSKAFGLRVLRVLKAATPTAIGHVLTIDDSADARSVLPLIRAYASESGMAVDVCASRDAAKRAILDYAPDICFVCGWYWLFDRETIDAVPGGIVGIHNSRLPKYRGGAPLVWALINGDTTVGSTVFVMGYGMDDGPVIGTVEVAVDGDDTIADVLQRLEDAVAGRLAGFWRGFLDGTILPVPQDHAQATFAAQRLPEDGLIDWSLDATTLHNFIRAQSFPYPGAFTVHEGRRITIARARPLPVTYHGRPGQVLQRQSDSVTIACSGHSAIELLETLEDGTPRPPAAIFTSLRVRLR